MPVIAGAASAGVKAVTGIYQIYEGNRIAKNNKRPTYEIPQAVKDMMSEAEMLQYQGLPESSKQQYIDNLSRNMAFSFGQADTRKAGLTGVAAINQQSQDAAKDILAKDAQIKLNNIDKLQNTRGRYGEYQDKAFTFNKANPYYEKANQAEALIGAGMQNLGGATNTAATVIGNSDFGGGTTSNPYSWTKKGKPTPLSTEEVDAQIANL